MLLVAVVRIKIIWATFLALWTNFYQHATLLLPSLLTAPRYFAGEVEFGVITQVPLRRLTLFEKIWCAVHPETMVGSLTLASALLCPSEA